MSKMSMRKIKLGNKAERIIYGKKDEIIETPNLIATQLNSYQEFLSEGLKEIFFDVSPIIDYSEDLILEFLDFRIEKENIKYTKEECKANGATYSAPLRVKARLINKKTDEIKEQDLFMGDIPLMTETGSFIINGSERVIVSQLMRSPGVYYEREVNKVGKELYSATVIPLRGTWLEYETNSRNVYAVRIDRKRKIPITTFIRAMGIGTDEEILDLFGMEGEIKTQDATLDATFKKDKATNHEEGLIEVYKKLRPGEPPTVDSAKSLLTNMFYDDRRYNLDKVGRYKYNKKLNLESRIVGFTVEENVVDVLTGEVLVEKGEVITREIAKKMQNSGNFKFVVRKENGEIIKVLSNLMVDLEYHTGFKKDEVGINEKVYVKKLKELMEEAEDKDELKELIIENKEELVPYTIVLEDILSSINYMINIHHGMGKVDNIDFLSNRRIRSVGELLKNRVRLGMGRMERTIKERMTTQDVEAMTPKSLINIKQITALIRKFFGSSQLSQFMDQNNPVSSMAHKRRLSALGPGGLSRERAGFEVRDINHTHYGRMCPIETPEGPNIGLINSLATYAKVNEYGFLETPYRIVDQSGDEPIVTDEYKYFDADEEEVYTIAQANEPLTKDGKFVNDKVTGRRGMEEGIEVDPKEVDLMDVSPKQMVSVSTSLIPFLENNDANRALMGANMQRQALPLVKPESPIIGTGVEYKAAKDSGVLVIAKNDGVVHEISANKITVKTDKGRDEYKLMEFTRSNQETCYNQIPIVNVGEEIKAGDVLADGPSTEKGELAIGNNPLMAFMTAKGYNFEDAILLSDRLVKEDVYTSVHIEEMECSSRSTKLGDEEITRDIPNVSKNALKNLDERGIIRIGAEVKTGDILVGKVTPKGQKELSAEEKLLRAIFGEKAREVRDTSKRLKHGKKGIVVDVKVFDKENCDTLDTGINRVVKVYVANKRKISVGDKMAGRHGNKGVISRIVPEEDMPFLPNGRPVDIVLNPLGVPSRMNIGQVLEMHLGLTAKVLNWKVATPVFEGVTTEELSATFELANDFANMKWKEFDKKWKKKLDKEIYEHLEENKEHRENWKGVPLNSSGKVWLRDGSTGDVFDAPATIGYMYYLKLHHIIDKKIHARATGPYSLVTQQPLGGKAQFGGQRFGEMEVWALEGYGASHVLEEVLTIKSDDVVGRTKAYEAIIKGKEIPESGLPESFNVLLREIKALGLKAELQYEDIKDAKQEKSEVDKFIDEFEIGDKNEEENDEDVIDFIKEDNIDSV